MLPVRIEIFLGIVVMNVDNKVHILIDDPLRDFLHPVQPGGINRIILIGQMIVPADRHTNQIKTGSFQFLNQFSGCFCSAPVSFIIPSLNGSTWILRVKSISKIPSNPQRSGELKRFIVRNFKCFHIFIPESRNLYSIRLDQ